MSQTPSIGRIVIFTDKKLDAAVPAIITKVEAGNYAYLSVFVPGQVPGYTAVPVPFAEEPKQGHWSWPPRV